MARSYRAAGVERAVDAGILLAGGSGRENPFADIQPSLPPNTDGDITDAGEGRFHFVHDANFNVVAMTDTYWYFKER